MPGLKEPPEKLLDLIYDAAAEPHLWKSVMTAIADFINADSGVLFGQSIGINELHFSYNGRCDEAFNDIYRARHLRNPWSLAMENQPVGRIVFSDEVVELSSIRRTLFFDELVRPQEASHDAMIALAARGGFRAAFNINRSERKGPYGEEERKHLAALVPHLCRSMQLGFRLDGYRALQCAAFDVLDRLAAGVVLLDQRARILYANAAARALGADGGILQLRDATIATWSPSHSQQLGNLIRAASRGAPAGSIAVPRPRDGQPLMILVSSVRGKDVARFTDLKMPNAAVLVFIVDPANRAGVPVEWIVDAYGLTQAEARVALAVSSGRTVPETASQLGSSPNTVRTQLNAVLDKTGTARQTELARLMASIGLLNGKGPLPPDES
ncbi:helix-turn-helix transcriptional regulator [Bradyrhizobium sp. LHD-71]|uniref:helix-turn-helix transcriptional regulator n=1 Tax=Bradyrhizobium sp. LHD-71 TaxID=3072141 RepID=UPI00280CBF38|nr:helix-turn-helix transcriptional regulator [Bradyrhizobium sp. LHD-71]MDQ8730559.1 helix-turn-helix transcriptional regulator [Bradyrhizobium sp. LHD-71]